MERNKFSDKLRTIVRSCRRGDISTAQAISRLGLLLEEDQKTNYEKCPDCEDGFKKLHICCNTCGGTNRVEVPRE